MKALILTVFACGTLFCVVALMFFRPSANSLAATTASHATFDTQESQAAIRELREATETCRLLLGWTEGTIIKERDFAAFALCMHPTLKKHNLLNK